MQQTLELKELREKNPDYIPRHPFEHQKDAFEHLSKLFTFKDDSPQSGILVLPTGAGKTFTAVNWICRNVLPKNVKVLWFAHTDHLLEQAYETFRSNILETHSRETINIRVVSSNPAYSKASDISPSDDILIVTTQTAISNWNTNATDGKGQKRKTAFEEFIDHSKDTKLFLVLDEAHHAPAYGCRSLLIGNKDKKGIRDMIPDLYLLGLTATPAYNDERRRGWLLEIFNTELFEKKGIIYEADKAKLIEEGILAIPVYSEKNTGEEIDVDDRLYNHLVREHKDLPEYIIEKLAENKNRNDFIIKEYLEKREKYGKTIIFADRWFQCVYIKEQLSKYGIKVDAVYTHIDATPATAEERNKRSTTENRDILKKFKDDKIDVLLNVKMLTEGTDVPSVNTVFVTRQTTSSILLTQMIGRALRGKKAGGGNNKDKANIVFFTDNWKKYINFPPFTEGEKDESEPEKIKGYYPVEYISIKLVEDLCKEFDGIPGVPVPYLEKIPVGWYETELLIEVDGEINKFTEFIIVYENTKEKFQGFIKEIPARLDSEWEKEKLDEKWMKKYAFEWINAYFDKEKDDPCNTLDFDLIRIARHIAQSGTSPVFYTFEQRDRHDLTKIARELIYKDEFAIQEKLQIFYNDPASLWKMFYKSFNRFKTAFDAEKNRVYNIIKFGTEPGVKIDGPPIKPKKRELTKEEKGQVLKRDNYTCLCCGKTKKEGKRVKLEIDHIIPFIFGGEATVENSQTLCSLCNRKKGINEVNFRIFASPRLTPPDDIDTFKLSEAEDGEVDLRRIVNMFYHCHAVSDVRIGLDKRSKNHYKVWEIVLYENNNPFWLIKKKATLLDFIHNSLNCPFVEDIKIISPGFISADEWNTKGLDFFNQGKNEEAIECYDKALDIEPEHVNTWHNKGVLLKKLRKNTEAIECYDKVLEINPEALNTWYNMGIILKEMGKNEEAMKCYDKALEINPGYFYAWNNKGSILYNQGKNEEAIECYDKALINNPSYVHAWYNKGVALERQGKQEESLKCYDKALEIDPEYELARKARDKTMMMLNKK